MKFFAPEDCWGRKSAQLIAEQNGVKVTMPPFKLGETDQAPEYMKKFPGGLYPAMETGQGVVYGHLPICQYLGLLRADLAPSVARQGEIASVMSLINERFVRPLVDVCQGNTTFEAFKPKCVAILDLIEKRLLSSTFLDEKLGYADFFFYAPFLQFFTAGYLDQAALFNSRPALLRWAVTLANQKAVKRICGDVDFEKAPKSAAKAAPKATEEDDDDMPKKKKNPLDDLPATTLVGDAWKREYSNTKDLVGEAMTWFWKNFDATGWSLWYMKYDKVEGECTVNYASSNLLRGFLQRVDPNFRKYSFGVFDVLGAEPSFEIEGVWLVRGLELPFELKDHVQYEYHTFRKLDHTNEADKKVVSDFWCNEVEINGVTIEDSKVWK